jgi:Zn-dependent protease
MLRFNPQLRGQENAAVMLLVSGVQMNIGLAIFNMLPLPPLDGSRIVERFIPYSQRNNWESVKRIGPFLLMVTLVSGARFLSGPINAATGAMYSLISHIAG